MDSSVPNRTSGQGLHKISVDWVSAYGKDSRATGRVGGLASSWRADTRDGRARAQLQRPAEFRAPSIDSHVESMPPVLACWMRASSPSRGSSPCSPGSKVTRRPISEVSRSSIVALPVATQLIVNRIAGLYGPVWKYASIEEATRVVVAVGGGAAVSFIELVILAQVTDATLPVMTMPPIAALLILLGCGGIRFQARLFALERQNVRGNGHVRTIIVGTDRAGVALARELHADEANGHLRLLGFVDGDRSLSHRSIHGVPVLGATRRSRAHLPGARCAPGPHRAAPTDGTRRDQGGRRPRARRPTRR